MPRNPMTAQSFFTGPAMDGNLGGRKELDPKKGWKRVGHGNVAWSVTSDAAAMLQPQDGALETRRRGPEGADVQAISTRPRLQSEPEDARLTGGTRSLMRRVMGLNVTAKPEPRKPAAAAPGRSHAQVA